MSRLACAVLLATAALAHAEILDVDAEAFSEDDHCVKGGEECALNALQAHARKVQAARLRAEAASHHQAKHEESAVEAKAATEHEAADVAERRAAAEQRAAAASERKAAAGQQAAAAGNASAGQWGFCTFFGCGGYRRGLPCQCNEHCVQYGNCCPDYQYTCRSGPPASAPSPPSRVVNECYATGQSYQLSWKAQGTDFFKDWTFVTEDMVHGAHQFTTRQEALDHGIIAADSSSARLAIGGLRAPSRPDEAYKRYSAHIRSNQAWDPAKSMIIAMKYHKVPVGCGVWPAFWTTNSDVVWPNGGELDMLEYPNMDANKVSFHTASHCRLDTSKLQRCLPHGSRGGGHNDCYTKYFENAFGCIPRQHELSGADFANRPGVISVVWTKEALTVYHFPDDQIPADLTNDKPEPDYWPSSAVLAYLPFAGYCDSIKPQEIVINVQLCGDAAGGPWGRSSCAHYTAQQYRSGQCVSGLSQIKDCCTQFVTRPEQEAILKANAQFNISYVKVFTPDGAPGTPSGTYKRGGVLLW